MDFSVVTFMLIALGGGLGSMARAAVSGLVNRHGHPAWGTFVVNVSGGFLIGAGFALFLMQVGVFNAAHGWEVTAWEVFAIGLLGGYTTVSSFALQTLDLWRAGAVRAAAVNALGSLLMCPLAAAMGAGFVHVVGG